MFVIEMFILAKNGCIKDLPLTGLAIPAGLHNILLVLNIQLVNVYVWRVVHKNRINNKHDQYESRFYSNSATHREKDETKFISFHIICKLIQIY